METIEKSNSTVLKEVRAKFDVLEELAQGVCTGGLNGLLISGRGGIGKTHTVRNVVRGSSLKARFISGHITPLQIHNTLYEFKEKNQIVIFDDCDTAFDNSAALNVMKAALDTYPTRTVTWESNTNKLLAPNSYQYDGKIIVITNKKLSGREEFGPLLSRVHHYHLQLSVKEKIIKIWDTVTSEANGFGVDQKVAKEIFNWMLQTADPKDDTVNIRTFVKIAQLAKFSPNNWKTLALYTAFEKKS